MRRVHRKIKKCGDIVGTYDYEKGYLKGYSKTLGLLKEEEDGGVQYYKVDVLTGEKIRVLMGRQNQGTVSDEESKKIRQRNFIKAKNKIKDLINTNAYSWKDNKGRSYRPKFLTLTYEEEMQDIKESNNELNKFFKRLNRYIKKEIDENYEGVQYVAVPEIQEKRLEKYDVEVWHYHILFFNLPYIKWNVLLEKWGLGSAWIEGFKDKEGNEVKMKYDNEKKCFVANKKDVHNIGAYITKTMNYMSKSLDSDKLKGKKCYFVSRKLKKPTVVEVTNMEDLKKEKAMLAGDSLSFKHLVFFNAYSNEHIGVCLYREYNMKFGEWSTMTNYDDFVLHIMHQNWGNIGEIKKMAER